MRSHDSLSYLMVLGSGSCPRVHDSLSDVLVLGVEIVASGIRFPIRFAGSGVATMPKPLPRMALTTTRIVQATTQDGPNYYPGGRAVAASLCEKPQPAARFSSQSLDGKMISKLGLLSRGVPPAGPVDSLTAGV